MFFICSSFPCHSRFPYIFWQFDFLSPCCLILPAINLKAFLRKPFSKPTSRFLFPFCTIFWGKCLFCSADGFLVFSFTRNHRYKSEKCNIDKYYCTRNKTWNLFIYWKMNVGALLIFLFLPNGSVIFVGSTNDVKIWSFPRDVKLLFFYTERTKEVHNTTVKKKKITYI